LEERLPKAPFSRRISVGEAVEMKLRFNSIRLRSAENQMSLARRLRLGQSHA